MTERETAGGAVAEHSAAGHSAAGPRRSPGRPRDASIGERALAATRDLLTERGFDATTMQAVAERAGVHASALYRRWPSRIEMITEATFPGLDPGSVAPTGDLRRDLRRFIRAYTAAFTAPAARAAAAGLLAHNQSSPAPRPPELSLRVSARPQFRAILAAAPPGTVDPALDPDDVFDLLLGAILVRVLLPAATARRQPAERVVDLVMRVLRADSAGEVGPGERPLCYREAGKGVFLGPQGGRPPCPSPSRAPSRARRSTCSARSSGP